jgi:Heparinase II/III-like protein/Heparinase II/III N-terminus
MRVPVARPLLLVLALGIASCAPEAPHTMMPDGEEVIYSFLSEGKKSVADEALNDVWDLGPRSKPVHIAPITWTENPFDKYWRVLFYSLRPLSNLLYAYYTTGNHAYVEKLLEVVDSYDAFDAARGTTPDAFLDDPHTTAFREMMLVNIYGKLTRSHDLPQATAAAMLVDIEKTGIFLADPKHFQDGENHGFNEAAALLVAAVNFPQLSESATWEALALSRLHGLMFDTIDDDGVEIENSPFYHFYVLSFVAQDSKWMHTYSVPVPDQFDERMGLMLDYATYSTQPDGYAPLLGSSVTLNVRKLLPNVYSENALDDMEGFAETSPEFTYIRSGAKAGTEPTARSKRYPVSGQSFLRSSFDADNFDDQTWMSLNAGPYRGPHCHKDTLGITYFSGGAALLVDSGLYEYDSPKSPIPDADYFHGTSGHNTVTVDGSDQSIDASDLASVSGGLVTSGDAWAYQSGSHGLYGGVTHSRAVVLLGQDLALVVDYMDSQDTHAYTQTWHLAPGATFAAQGLDIVAEDATGSANLALHQGITNGLGLASSVGEESPLIQGWYSAEYGDKVSSAYVTAPASVVVTFAGANPNISVAATVCVGQAALDVSIQNLAASGETVSVAPSTSCPSSP